MSGRCLKGAYAVYGKCLDSAWIVSGLCLNSVWKGCVLRWEDKTYLEWEMVMDKTRFKCKLFQADHFWPQVLCFIHLLAQYLVIVQTEPPVVGPCLLCSTELHLKLEWLPGPEHNTVIQWYSRTVVSLTRLSHSCSQIQGSSSGCPHSTCSSDCRIFIVMPPPPPDAHSHPESLFPSWS